MKKKNYGCELILDLYECGPETISSRKKIREYVNRLCRMIRMKKYGKTWIPYFGEKHPHTKGYSLVQLIETSSIVGHFSEQCRSAYIDIFSCKPFDAEKAKEFTRKFFGAGKVKARLLVRR